MFAAQLQAAPSHVLANEKIRVTISGDGQAGFGRRTCWQRKPIHSVRIALRWIPIWACSRTATTPPPRVTAGKQRIVYHYEFGAATRAAPASISADLVYTLAANNGFFRRALSISNAAPLRVKNLVFGATTFASPARETVHYLTFIAAPTVEFIRH